MSGRDLHVPAPSGMLNRPMASMQDTARPYPVHMSPECGQALEDAGLEAYAFPGNPLLVLVYDKATRARLFDITAGIDPRDLRTLLHIRGARQLDAYERGREAMRADFRHLMGVDR